MAGRGRSRWWRLHAWVGLKLSLCLFVIFLSGTFAVVANEIDWLIDPALRAAPDRTMEASFGTIADAAMAAVPGARIDAIERGPDRWFATTVLVKAPDGHRRRVLVDPETGTVNRVAGFASVQRFLRDLHRRLMLPAAIGIPLVSSFAFLVATSLVTGLMTYKKFWRGFVRAPRTSGGRVFVGDLHRLGGLWSLWFVALMAATGIWYFAEVVGAGSRPLLPLAPRGAVQTPPTQPDGAEIDRLAGIARAAFPQLWIKRVMYPFPGMGAVGFQGYADTALTTEKANAIFVDRSDGSVAMRVTGADLDAHSRISEGADPLHFGTWGGLASKLVWFVFGATLTGLAASGVVIFALRVGGGTRGVVAAISWWLVLPVVLLVAAAWFTPGVLAG